MVCSYSTRRAWFMSSTLRAFHWLIMIIFPHNTSKVIAPVSRFRAWNVSSAGRYINLTFQPEVQRVSCMEEHLRSLCQLTGDESSCDEDNEESENDRLQLDKLHCACCGDGLTDCLHTDWKLNWFMLSTRLMLSLTAQPRNDTCLHKPASGSFLNHVYIQGGA